MDGIKNMPTKSLILERKGEKDGFAQRFGKEIPEGSHPRYQQLPGGADAAFLTRRQ